MYSRTVGGSEHTFGVSGRLYKSNVLLYDHQTESLWSQLMDKAITGPAVGRNLSVLPSSRIKWKTWRQRNPGTRVLSDDTGFYRDYSIDPYEGYYRMGSLMFPVGDVRRDMAAKEPVLGIEIENHAKAYRMDWLRNNPGTHQDRVGSHPVRIEVSPEGEVVGVRDKQGVVIPATYSYWFAWQAFHRETEVYQPKN
ncbi:hypothetical protein D1AOALGA4SA_7285 [Olavius algarvensis Delta 1 endosymbiont]|nr:hypothetical protein D1AOALGA4SA_7285 [Olavius algarvensis Delta 1 endosymbiont]